jgi:hypothetical protein
MKKSKLARRDRHPSDHGTPNRNEKKPNSKGKSWTAGDKGQGREGFSKGYGGSGGKGTGVSGPERK